MGIGIGSLIATRTVTVSGRHRLGVSVKLTGVAMILVLLSAQAALPPLVPAAGLALILAALVYVERVLISPVILTYARRAPGSLSRRLSR